MTIYDILLVLGALVVAYRYVIVYEKFTLKTHLYFVLGLALTEIYSIYLFCERKSLILVYANSILFLAVVAITVVIIATKLKQAEYDEDNQAYFISKIDNGSVIITPCKVDEETKEITDIITCDCKVRGKVYSEAVLVYGNEYGVRTIEEPACRRYADINDELLF